MEDRMPNDHATIEARAMLAAFPGCHGSLRLKCNTARHLARQEWDAHQAADYYIPGHWNLDRVS